MILSSLGLAEARQDDSGRSHIYEGFRTTTRVCDRLPSPLLRALASTESCLHRMTSIPKASATQSLASPTTKKKEKDDIVDTRPPSSVRLNKISRARVKRGEMIIKS